MTTAAGRILGIDYGTRRIGLAISDPLRIIAQGAGTHQNDPGFLERFVAILEDQEVVLVVVGIPYSPDGGKSAKALEVDRFIDQLRQVTPIKIDVWDESYSSRDAKDAFIASGMRKKRRRQKERVDEMAARIMLQQYLDHHGL